MKSHIGIYGLGVMGKNLALNFEEQGYTVSIYNREAEGEKYVVDEFLAFEGLGKQFYGAKSIEKFVESLESPRKILLMVKAGSPVDKVIYELLPHLDKNDILIDGGNSNFTETNRRSKMLESLDIRYIGMGVSGGEEGARHGPSLMPGGDKNAWPVLEPMLKKIAATSFDGSPCCAWMGNEGSGHLVKMIHNGIEYADMQLIAESYHIMKNVLNMNAAKISETFQEWTETELDSYLIEITAEILKVNDVDGFPLVDKILDAAGQKGTGKWTAVSALDAGIPLPVISQAVYSRYSSSLTELRRMCANHEKKPVLYGDNDRDEILHSLAQSLFASRMTAYAEGFHLITSIGTQKNWEIDPASIALIWQGGCIIRSDLLNDIRKAFISDLSLQHLFLSGFYQTSLKKLEGGWRKTVKLAIDEGIPVPCMSAALNQYDTLRSDKLPANLIQAQRDYFGAHTYERTDRVRGKFFHTNWKGEI